MVQASGPVTKNTGLPDPETLLNSVVSNLFHRTTVPVADRAAKLGALTVIENPDQADEIFRRHEDFGKDFVLIGAIGRSRFNTNGATWTGLRSRTQKFYAQAGRNQQKHAVAEIYAQELGRLDNPDHAAVQNAFFRSALRVFFSAFGIDPDVDPFLGHISVFRQLVVDLQYYSWVHPEDGQTTATLMETTDAAVEAFWKTCQQNDDVKNLVLGFSPDHDAMSLRDTVSDFVTNMFAGIETTTASLCWFLDCLGKNPQVQDRCFDSQKPEHDGPDYTEILLRESMRCFPPIPFVTRTALRDCDLDGVPIPKGHQFMISIIGLHRWPTAWKDSGGFYSAREEFIDTTKTPFAFRPFLSGPRVCGGRRLAELEISVGSKELVRKFVIRNPEPNTPYQYALALRPIPSPAFKIENR